MISHRNPWKFLSFVLIGITLVISTMLIQANVSSVVSLPAALATHAIPDNSVHSSSIINDQVTSADIASGAVGALEIANNAVGPDEIQFGAVGSGEIADGAVGSGEIATNAVGFLEIASSAVGASEIANGAVGSSELGIDLAFPGRTSYSPFTMTVASDGTSAEASFGIPDEFHNYIEITCTDVNGCNIPSSAPIFDIDAGVPGQILILSASTATNIVIIEQLDPPPGVTGLNLGATTRTLADRDDTIMLLFQNGEWSELNFKNNGNPP